MSEALTLSVSGLVGAVLGAIFFGGLWWTVSRGLSSRRPALWFFLSLPVRMGITLGGFRLVMGSDGRRLLPCLLGFSIAGLVVTRLTRPAAAREDRAALETGHAP